MPDLAPLPDHRQIRILIGTSVRKPLAILKPFLDSLAWQELPPRTTLVPVFVADWPEKKGEAYEFLKEWVSARGGEVLRGSPDTVGDFVDNVGDSHQWTLSSMRRVGANKNKIITRALELSVDAIFFADADLILDRTTLASLIAAEKFITTAVYWTH